MSCRYLKKWHLGHKEGKMQVTKEKYDSEMLELYQGHQCFCNKVSS